MAQRRPGHLKSPEANLFYPQFAPVLEAPYVRTASAPSLPPHAPSRSAYSFERFEDVERMARKQSYCDLAARNRERHDKSGVARRQQLEQERKQNKGDSGKRLKDDKVEREKRWTQKTAGHPFADDQWAIDEKVYKFNRINDDKIGQRQKRTEKAIMEDQAKRRFEKIAEVDVLGNLRREKKKLQEDQKELKARLDLDKVDQRCAAAKHKMDMKFEAHQRILASKGHLDRSHSDFFTEPRLRAEDHEALLKKKRAMEKRVMNETSGNSQASTLPSGAGVSAQDVESMGGSDFAETDGKVTAETSGDLAEVPLESSLGETPLTPKTFMASVTTDGTDNDAHRKPSNTNASTVSGRSEPFSSPARYRPPPGKVLG